MSVPQFTIETFNLNKLYHEQYNFITSNSKDIDLKLIKFAEKNINRHKTVIEFNNLIYDIKTSIALENGIFEFSLLHIHLNHLMHELFVPTYEDKVHEIYINLDKNNKYINNETLFNDIYNKVIPARVVAFMSPDQINPKKYSDILDKKKYREDKENNLATSDAYKCSKCGERKVRVTEMQLRCADEPTNKIITCLVCYKTFVI
jgi:DNA-directed RNA polymerase subunit M/transcription elongation factor TFIIS